MLYFKVKNWEKFQHYKDRNPPWIKLHNSLMTDSDFLCLQDASKLHLILIWLLASRTGNKIPGDETLLAKLLIVNEPVKIDPLVSAGFLIPYDECLQDASNTLASCLQSACPETETETEGEREFKRLCSAESEKPDSSLPVISETTLPVVDEIPDPPKDDQSTPPAKKPKPWEVNFDARFEWLWGKWPSQRRTSRKEATKALRSALKRAEWEKISTGVRVYVRSPYVTSRVEMGEFGSIKTLPAWLNADRWEVTEEALIEPCRSWSEKHRDDPLTLADTGYESRDPTPEEIALAYGDSTPSATSPPDWDSMLPEPVPITPELHKLAWGDDP